MVVARIFLIVWPPEGEERFVDIDISLGLEIAGDPSRLVVVSISRSDNWTPEVRREDLGEYLPSEQFDAWIDGWMKMELGGVFCLQRFDFSCDSRFSDLIGQSIIGVETLSVANESAPFGVKISLSSDNILVVPISDGATILTRQFGDWSALECFQQLGTITYSPVR